MSVNLKSVNPIDSNSFTHLGISHSLVETMITPNSELRTPNFHDVNNRSRPIKTTRQVSLQTKLLSIVLPTIIGTLALSSLIGYRLIHKTAERRS